jgi:tetratricopeptide (TPR) repeat protein
VRRDASHDVARRPLNGGRTLLVHLDVLRASPSPSPSPSPYRSRRLARGAALALAPLVLHATAQAQEFVRQTLLIAPLHPVGSPSVTRQVAGAVRSRTARLSNKREVRVLDTDTTEILLQRAGFRPDTVFDDFESYALAKQLRADEFVVGTVTGRTGNIEVRAYLVLTRDRRLRQPLPPVRGGTAGAVADTLSRAIVRARQQMLGLRRCENAARHGDAVLAVRSAEAAIQLYPASTLAKTCLMLSLPYVGAGADSSQRIAQSILAIDSMNVLAAVVLAQSEATLQHPSAAADAWMRVIAIQPDSLELGLGAIEELLKLQRPATARDAARKLAVAHKNDDRVRRLAFRAMVTLSAWKDARALGDSLDLDDPEFRDDSSYAVRYVEALRLTGDTIGAIARSARAVKQHPGDVLLYVQYVKLLAGENVAALGRGLARFPGASELHVLAARAALANGKKRDALASLGEAVTRDPTLVQGYLQMAEIWFDESQPDSAVQVVARAPRTGAGAPLVRAYAIGRGRQVIRAASDSTPALWRTAVALFSIADSVDAQEDSRQLLAAATLQLARSELTLAARDRACPDAARANEALGIAATLLARAPADGTNTADGDSQQMQQAYDALRTAVDNAVRVLCTAARTPSESTGSSSTRRVDGRHGQGSQPAVGLRRLRLLRILEIRVQMVEAAYVP